eukprot:SAG11_NODE_174_length_13505_cov_9.126585_12_plen_211_part_00
MSSSESNAQLKKALKKWARTVRTFDTGHLREMFSQIDADGSGALDRVEFGKLVQMMDGLNLGTAEIDQAFNEIDEDGGGTIQFDELTAFFDRSAGLRSQAAVQLQSKMKVWAKKARNLDMGLLQEMFNSVDTDGSLSIDKNEFGTLVAKLGMQLTDEEVEVAFRDVDVDSGGTIDFDVRLWQFYATHFLLSNFVCDCKQSIAKVQTFLLY